MKQKHIFNFCDKFSYSAESCGIYEKIKDVAVESKHFIEYLYISINGAINK